MILMQTHKAEHLSKNKKVQLGSYYTPENLVTHVYNFIKPYLMEKSKETVIFDSAGGCGAFLNPISNHDYRIADCDKEACNFLETRFDKNKVFCTNSLINVDRNKYTLPPNAYLIMIGNPPYNDTTSQFRSGEKGENICDDDLRDRDLGISFLRSYNKLKADIVCILHPFSYLVKEVNFKRLRDFRENYRLIKGELFSSAAFSGTGGVKFPVLIALYERNSEGMTYDYIREFKFNILDSNKIFTLKNYNTTDGYINKYPPRVNDTKKSPIDLYYYTFRDFNSLKKNTSFFGEEHYNGIVVTLENFYKYAYLYSLKSLFNPENSWLYGNLSPLVNLQDLEQNKELYVAYAIKTNRFLKIMDDSIKARILNFYNLKIDKVDNMNRAEEEIKVKLRNLV